MEEHRTNAPDKPKEWTVRDEFASRVLIGILAHSFSSGMGNQAFAEVAYAIADCMMAERQE